MDIIDQVLEARTKRELKRVQELLRKEREEELKKLHEKNMFWTDYDWGAGREDE